METCIDSKNSKTILVPSWICFHVPSCGRKMPLWTARIVDAVFWFDNSGRYGFSELEFYRFRQSAGGTAMDLRLFPVGYSSHFRHARSSRNGCRQEHLLRRYQLAPIFVWRRGLTASTIGSGVVAILTVTLAPITSLTSIAMANTLGVAFNSDTYTTLGTGGTVTVSSTISSPSILLPRSQVPPCGGVPCLPVSPGSAISLP